MRSVARSVAATTVAVRGTSHRIAISPMMSFLPQARDLDRAARRVDHDVGDALEDDVGRVADVALMEQLVPGHELEPLAGERQELELGRLDLGEQRDRAQDLDVLAKAHATDPPGS